MATKTFKGRIQNKHDTEVNWSAATNFRPLAGELIIYDEDDTHSTPRLKIGNGNTLVNNLPFYQGGTALNLENGAGEGSLSQVYLQDGKNINKAKSQGSVALGHEVTVQENTTTNETGFCGYAEGGGTLTEGQFGHAEGEMTKALARGTHAEGKSTEALGMYCHVEGSENTAGFIDTTEGKTWGDQAAHAEGMLNKAKGRYSHAEGKNNIVGNGSGNGESSHVEGENNTVMGNVSHVEGSTNTVNGNYTHVEGSGNSVSATTNNGHVEGFKNTISSNYGHVGGLSSEVSGTGAFAHGNGVKANKYFQTVFGQFNNPDAIDAGQTAIFQVGVGKSEDARTNAFEILYDGRAKVLAAPKSANDVVRKKELDNKVDKVEGKDLSTNDFTNDEKNKLAGIETGAQKNTITGVKGSAETSYRIGNVNITKTNIGLGNVDDVKQYSATNPNFGSTSPLMDGTASVGSATTYARSDHKHPTDTSRASTAVATTSTNGLMSSLDKTKLDGIETGAQVNEIETITAGSNVTVSKSGKTVTISATGGGGTAVVANPTLTGSEANLTALQVGATKYGIKTLKVTIW